MSELFERIFNMTFQNLSFDQLDLEDLKGKVNSNHEVRRQNRIPEYFREFKEFMNHILSVCLIIDSFLDI